MKTFISLFLLLSLQVLLYYSKESILKFTTHADITFRKYDYLMKNEYISVDSYLNQQVLIKVIKDQGFKYSCQVDELDDRFIIRKAELCWKLVMKDNETCVTITEKKQSLTRLWNSFDIEYDNRTGFVATKTSGYLQGHYYCKLTNRIDSIISNTIEFHSIDYYRKLFVDSFSEDKILKDKSIRSRSDSHVFEFGKKVKDNFRDIPSWIIPFISESIRWRICPVENYNYTYIWAECFRNGYEMKLNEDYVQFSNFSIRIFDHVYTKFDKFVLESLLTIVMNPTFNKYPIQGSTDMDRDLSEEIVIEPIESNEFHVREGDNSFFKYKISAAYTGIADLFRWSRLTLPITPDFIQTERELILPPFITREHEGIFMLTLIGTNKQIYKLQFKLIVIVVPKISPNFQIHQTLFTLPNTEVNYKLRILGKGLNNTVKINKYPLDFTDTKSRQSSLKNLFTEYPYLSMIQLENSKVINEDFIDIIGKIRNVEKLSETNGQFLSLNFDVENSVGIVRIRSIISVVDFPIWRRTVDEVECFDECTNNRDYLFLCNIFDDEYISKNFKIEYKWNVNGEQIHKSNQDSLINVEKGSLILKKNPVGQSINYKIGCSLQLYAPQIFINENRKFEEIYNSLKDESVMRKLEKNITIIPASEIKFISLDVNILIIGSCMAIVIVVIVLVICILFCTSQRKAYNIDEADRAIGINPEAEFLNDRNCEHVDEEVYMMKKLGFKKNKVRADLVELEDDSFHEGSMVGEYRTNEV